MARTIPRRIPPDFGKHDYIDRCGYCGVPYYRSELRGPDGSGLLRCPKEGDGKDATTLLRREAQNAAEWASRQGRTEANIAMAKGRKFP